MGKQNGLSSQCTLQPMLVIALAMQGQPPCKNCNEDRAICRGEPKGSQQTPGRSSFWKDLRKSIRSSNVPDHAWVSEDILGVKVPPHYPDSIRPLIPKSLQNEARRHGFSVVDADYKRGCYLVVPAIVPTSGITEQ